MDKNLPPLAQGYHMQALFAGEIAFTELTQRQAGRVFGVTSRGVFIRSTPGGILFLSFEEFRGPLTINLPEPFTHFQALQNGQPASTGENRLKIPAARIEIMVDPEVVWRILPPDLTRKSDRPTRLANCIRLAGMVSAEKKNAGLGALLPALLDPGEENTGRPMDAALQRHWPEVLHLRRALQERDAAAALDALSAFLGCGHGLTPSGDDFAMGLLLMINRWGTLTWDDSWRSTLDEKVVLAARQKTTALSASLIACAARPSAPQADERLVDAADYLCTGCGDAVALAAALSGWGSSSGIDALVGMTLGVLSSTP
jgi:hypothetical protein